MSLLTLSNELLDRILEHCDTKSIKCSRLASGRLRNVANRHLLRELPLYYNRDSLDLIDALTTTHQDFAKGIKAVWFQADRLANLPTFTSWNEKRKKQFEDYPFMETDWRDELQVHNIAATSSITPELAVQGNSQICKVADDYLKRCFRTYQEFFDQQCELDSSTALREKSAALFRMCPKLTSLWITSAGVVRPTTIHKSASFRRGLVFSRASDYDENVRITSQLLLGVLDSGTNLDTLVLGGVDYRLLEQGEPQMSNLGQVLQHLKQFQWDVGETFAREREELDRNDVIDDGYVVMGPHTHFGEFPEMYRIVDDGLFDDFLDHATNLRTLVISAPGIPDTTLRPADFSDIVGDLTFPSLESLSIKLVSTVPKKLETFLLRHSNSLKHLRMCEMHLDPHAAPNATWRPFFEDVGGKLPRLESVCLRGGFHQNGGTCYVFGWSLSHYVGTRMSRAMEAFMINGGEEVPVQKSVDHSDDFAQMSRAQLLEWAGEAMVPEIQPEGWVLS